MFCDEQNTSQVPSRNAEIFQVLPPTAREVRMASGPSRGPLPAGENPRQDLEVFQRTCEGKGIAGLVAVSTCRTRRKVHRLLSQ